MSVSWFARGLLVGFAVVVYGLVYGLLRLLWPRTRKFHPTKSVPTADRWCFWIGFAVGFVGFGMVLVYAAVHDSSSA